MSTYVFIGLAVLFNTAASLAMKVALNTEDTDAPKASLLQSLVSFPLIFAMTCYLATFVFFSLALRGSPLHTVQPVITGGTIALVSIGAAIIIGETFSIRAIVGLALVLAGVTLLLVKQ